MDFIFTCVERINSKPYFESTFDSDNLAIAAQYVNRSILQLQMRTFYRSYCIVCILIFRIEVIQIDDLRPYVIRVSYIRNNHQSLVTWGMMRKKNILVRE